MIRYIIEKFVDNGYGHGYATIMENDRPRKFVTEEQAHEWLVKNDEDYSKIPYQELHLYYKIKQCIV